MQNKRYRQLITLLTFVLVAFGIFMVYSASNIWAEAKFNDSYYYLKRQSLFALLGFIGFFIASKIPSDFLYKHAEKFIIIALILLGLVLIPGLGIERNGSRSWFGIGPFAIQPSELFKIAIVIYAAKYISNNFKETKKLRGFWLLLIVMMIGFVLIMLQPDFGTAMVILLGLIIMMFVTRLPIKYFFILGGLGVTMIVGLILVAPYRFERIKSFIDPWSDPLGSGFQIIQSLYAIGPGALLGNGL